MPLMRSEILLPTELTAPTSVAPATLVYSCRICPGMGKELYVNRSNLPVLTCPSGGVFSG